VSHRGTGPSCSFRGAEVYRTDKDKILIAKFKVSVGFLPDEDDEQPGQFTTVYSDFYDVSDERDKEFEFVVPTELITNFTQVAFDKWIADLKSKKETSDLAEASKTVADIMERYPPEKFPVLLERIVGVFKDRAANKENDVRDNRKAHAKTTRSGQRAKAKSAKSNARRSSRN
jgi:hypothetical protein